MIEHRKAPCGCTLTVTHTKGERRIYCSCGIAWKARVIQPTTISIDIAPVDPSYVAPPQPTMVEAVGFYTDMHWWNVSDAWEDKLRRSARDASIRLGNRHWMHVHGKDDPCTDECTSVKGGVIDEAPTG